MKNLKTKIVVLSVFVIAVLLIPTGCSKDRVVEVEPEELTAYDSPNEFLNSKAQEEQVFVIDSGGTCPLVCKYKTELCVGKSWLMFANSDSVYFPYELRVVENLTIRDMIYGQMPSVAGGSILETAGQLKVTAYKDDAELHLRNGGYYEVKIPDSTAKSTFESYYGFETTSFTDYTNDPAALAVSTVNTPVFSDTANGYSNNIVKLGWLICGESKAATTNYNLTFTSTTDVLTNLAIFVAFTDINGVLQVKNQVSGSIPTGSVVTVIAIGMQSGGKVFSFVKDITVTSSQDVVVTMSATTEDALEELLVGL
jgi:hypothetical protein